jgi:hypothetical protein
MAGLSGFFGLFQFRYGTSAGRAQSKGFEGRYTDCGHIGVNANGIPLMNCPKSNCGGVLDVTWRTFWCKRCEQKLYYSPSQQQLDECAGDGVHDPQPLSVKSPPT